MRNLAVQIRSNKVDIFDMISYPELGTKDVHHMIARPASYKPGKATTNPEDALLTLSVKDARDLGRKLLRAVGGEGL